MIVVSDAPEATLSSYRKKNENATPLSALKRHSDADHDIPASQLHSAPIRRNIHNTRVLNQRTNRSSL